jgi:Zn-dependent protease with chaperone function
MATIDFDFQRYVERRKGAREASAREGAAYAYAGDLRVLRTLDRMRPVRLALEATERMWRSTARAEMLSGAVKVGPREQPEVYALVQRCAEALHVVAPPAYVATQHPGMEAHTFGADDESYLVLDGGLIERLNEAELTDVIGRELGHIQNQHVLYATALYYLDHFAARFVRWVVTPARLALGSWAKRAAITCDRAGLICTRNIDTSAAALTKLGATPQRVEALRVFAESAYYRGLFGQEGGLSPEACDQRAAELLK